MKYLNLFKFLAGVFKMFQDASYCGTLKSSLSGCNNCENINKNTIKYVW